jgi:hypothetical protein
MAVSKSLNSAERSAIGLIYPYLGYCVGCFEIGTTFAVLRYYGIEPCSYHTVNVENSLRFMWSSIHGDLRNL